MSLHEIVLEETKPETEWVRGRALQKVSPTYRHALCQRRLAAALGAWAEEGGHGRVGTEWRFRVTPPGEVTRPLVPDVAYLSYGTLGRNAPLEELDVPRLAPTVAIEILSPDDREIDVLDKVQTYRAAGTVAVLVVDPAHESATVRDVTGVRTVRPPERLVHAALPGFSLDLAALFSLANA